MIAGLSIARAGAKREHSGSAAAKKFKEEACEHDIGSWEELSNLTHCTHARSKNTTKRTKLGGVKQPRNKR